MKYTLVSSLVLLGVACTPASTHIRATDPVAVDQSATSTVGAATDGAPAEASLAGQSVSGQAIAAAASPRPTADGPLAIWKDPLFQRRFQESYLAETEIEPRVSEDERDGLQAVLTQIAAEKTDAAIVLLEPMRGAEASAVIDFTLGNLWFQQEKFDLAGPAYQVAVDKYPKFRRAWKNLGLIHIRAGRPAPAARAFSRVIELGGSDAITYGLLGFAHAGSGDHVASETAYRLATLLDPDTADWSMGLARSFFEQQRFAEAAALCATLIARHPNRADLWLLQANAYLGLNQPMRAAENLEFVDRLGAATPESLNTLGDICVNEEIFDVAVDSYVEALHRKGDAKPERALRAARVLIANGARFEARALLEGVEAVCAGRLAESDRKDVLRLRARLAVAEQAGDKEVALLEEIVALDPLDGEALILLGQHAGRTGDTEGAILYFERAANLDTFEADAKIRHAQLLVGVGKYADALPLLRRAQTLKPRDNIQEYLTQVERAAQAR